MDNLDEWAKVGKQIDKQMVREAGRYLVILRRFPLRHPQAHTISQLVWTLKGIRNKL